MMYSESDCRSLESVICAKIKVMLDTIDWVIIGAYLLLSLYIGYRYKDQAGKSLSDFFLGGRNMPWFVAGISMVATTFAADTPLWVTEVIAQHGISGNWLWWNMLIGGMLTTFFFAKLWRRADILTELEFIELRYSGAPARFLRGFKAVYMGLLLNVVIIGWVNYAMMTILQVFFGIPAFDASIPFFDNEIIWYLTGAMLIVVFYSSLAGLKGVAITDTIQFVIAMAGCIIMAIFVVNEPQIGGISGLKDQLPDWRFSFFPVFDGDSSEEGVYSISLASFLTFALVQWWASWYPGAEPGGGGYVAQRMMSTRNERGSVLATLLFQVTHYCLRPWPWILVGLCALVLYPDLPKDETGQGFVLIMRDVLPSGLKGLLLVAFLSAYMSTISTQLNWGASFLTNDLYKRFIKPSSQFESEEKAQKHYVSAARFFTLGIMLVAIYVTSQIETIDAAAKFLIQAGAGLGLVLILRWFWWRINAWSEIAASLAPLFGYYFFNNVIILQYPYNFLATILLTTVVWVSVTYLTNPEPNELLQKFYERVRPGGWWSKYSKGEKEGYFKNMMITWFFALISTYSLLFVMGYVIFGEWQQVGIWLAVGSGGSFFFLRFVKKIL